MNLYTVLVAFSDRSDGIDQYQAETPFDALKRFIETAEALNGFNREKIFSALGQTSLIHTKPFRGVWLISLVPTLPIGPNDNALLGGYVIQNDPTGPMRE